MKYLVQVLLVEVLEDDEGGEFNEILYQDTLTEHKYFDDAKRDYDFRTDNLEM